MAEQNERKINLRPICDYDSIDQIVFRAKVLHHRYPAEVARTEYISSLLRSFFLNPEYSTRWDALVRYLFYLRKSLDDYHGKGGSNREASRKIFSMRIKRNREEIIKDLEEAVNTLVTGKRNLRRAHPKVKNIKKGHAAPKP
ncbi:MAG: hypothetical protein RR733_04520 [Victivallaceae bacterium]